MKLKPIGSIIKNVSFYVGIIFILLGLANYMMMARTPVNMVMGVSTFIVGGILQIVSSIFEKKTPEDKDK